MIRFPRLPLPHYLPTELSFKSTAVQHQRNRQSRLDITMSQATGVSLAYPTKEAFQSQGLSNVLLHAALDCSICREPLAITLEHESCSVLPAAVLSIGHTTVNAQEIEGLTMSGQDSTTAASPDQPCTRRSSTHLALQPHLRSCLPRGVAHHFRV